MMARAVGESLDQRQRCWKEDDDDGDICVCV